MKPPIRTSLAIVVALLAPGCASTTPRPLVAPMGAREAQTRYLENVTAAAAMKAAIDMLQDGDFSIDRTDSALGLVIGTRSISRSPTGGEKALKWVSIGFTYGLAALLPWTKSEMVQVEASVNVTPIGGGSRVRVTFQRRVLDNHGRVKKIEMLNDPTMYRDLFDQLARSLFVAEER